MIDMSEAKVKAKKERESTKSVRVFEDVFMVMVRDETEKIWSRGSGKKRVLSFPCRNVHT